jgi:hypothetical protein
VQALRRLSPHAHIVHLLEVLHDAPTGRLALVFELMVCEECVSVVAAVYHARVFCVTGTRGVRARRKRRKARRRPLPRLPSVVAPACSRPTQTNAHLQTKTHKHTKKRT